MACFSEPVSGMERQDDSSVKKVFFFLLLFDKYPLKVGFGFGKLSGGICCYRCCLYSSMESCRFTLMTPSMCFSREIS